MGFLVKDALGRSPYWIAVYKGTDGRQRRTITKAREKRVAREILRGLEAAEFLGATQSATEEQFRHLIREVASRTTGRPFVDPTIRHIGRDGAADRDDRQGASAIGAEVGRSEIHWQRCRHWYWWRGWIRDRISITPAANRWLRQVARFRLQFLTDRYSVELSRNSKRNSGPHSSVAHSTV